MGASYKQMTVAQSTAPTSEKLTTMFRDIQDQARRESGEMYSGDWNMARGLRFTGLTFANVADAEEYLEEHAEKWGPALVVTVGEVAKKWVIGAWVAE